MGSFNQTCAISGLPITPGKPVRYFLLVENRPRLGSSALHNTDWYAPRTFPLRGIYSDCGDLENVQDGLQREIWMLGLQLDMIEHGTGSNPCHDKATFKDKVKFDQLTDLIHESVLFVEREPGYAAREARWATRDAEIKTALAKVREAHGEDGEPEPAEPVPAFVDKSPGIPYLQAVRHYIEAAGGTVVDDWSTAGYLVSENGHADLSVRWEQLGTAAQDVVGKLELIRPALQEHYETVLMPGRMRHPMLRLFPKLGTKDFHGFDGHDNMRRWAKEAEERMMVSKAFVREDVWQAILGMELNNWRLGKVTLATYVAHARTAYDAYVAHLVRRKAMKARDSLNWTDEDYDDFGDFFYTFGGVAGERKRLQDNPVMWLLSKSGEGHFRGVSLQDHFKLFAAADPSDGEVEAFLRVVAEMAFVQTVMNFTWQMWVPSRYHGQDHNEDAHMGLRVRIAKVAEAWHAEEAAKRAEWDAEDADFDKVQAAEEKRAIRLASRMKARKKAARVKRRRLGG